MVSCDVVALYVVIDVLLLIPHNFVCLCTFIHVWVAYIKFVDLR